MSGVRLRRRGLPSFTMTPEVLTRDTRVKDGAYRLWNLLDRHVRADESAMPSRKDLADDLGRSVDSVDRAVDNLIDTGWLEVDQNEGKPSTYTLVYPETDEPPVDHSGDRNSAVTRMGSRKNAGGGTANLRPPAGIAPIAGSLKGEGGAHSATSPARQQQRGTRLPADWEPDPDLKEWTRKEVHGTPVSPGRQLLQFRDYWVAKSGRNATKVDWPATWRRWIREEIDRSGGLPPSQQGPSEAVRHPAYRSAAEVRAEQDAREAARPDVFDGLLREVA